jgi:hypothetical protein
VLLAVVVTKHLYFFANTRWQFLDFFFRKLELFNFDQTDQRLDAFGNTSNGKHTDAMNLRTAGSAACDQAAPEPTSMKKDAIKAIGKRICMKFS